MRKKNSSAEYDWRTSDRQSTYFGKKQKRYQDFFFWTIIRDYLVKKIHLVSVFFYWMFKLIDVRMSDAYACVAQNPLNGWLYRQPIYRYRLNVIVTDAIDYGFLFNQFLTALSLPLVALFFFNFSISWKLFFGLLFS